MPLYTYLNLTTGKHEAHMRSIAERDTLPGFERIFEPCHIPPPSQLGTQLCLQAKQVLDGYKKLEARGELRKSASEAAQIRDTWRNFTTAEAAAEDRQASDKEKKQAEAAAN